MLFFERFSVLIYTNKCAFWSRAGENLDEKKTVYKKTTKFTGVVNLLVTFGLTLLERNYQGVLSNRLKSRKKVFFKRFPIKNFSIFISIPTE